MHNPTLWLSLCTLAAFISCHKSVKSEKGAIDVISNVYYDASKGLDHLQTFHISKLNYHNGDLIEIVPDLTFPEINDKAIYIKDSIYYTIKDPSSPVLFSELRKTMPHRLHEKTFGTLFVNDFIPNYLHRRNLSDTVLFGKKYKRFEIKTKNQLARYYVYKTDTILPYSLYGHVAKDYSGRIERIDSYNREKDIFVTIQLLPRKTWDKEAEELFKFNDFAAKHKK